MVRLSLFIFSTYLTSSTFATNTPWGVTQIVSIPRGGSDGTSYSSLCEDVKCSIIEAANKQVRYHYLYK